MKFRLSTNSVLKRRLLDAIDSMEYDITHFPWGISSSSKAPASIAIQNAREQAKNCEFDKGWNQVHIAEQHLVLSMNQPQMDIKAAMLRKEATKLIGWRKAQIDYLLGTSDKPRIPPALPVSPNQLLAAMKVRNDFYNTRNHKMALHKSSVNTLAWFISIILVAIIILAFILDFTKQQSLENSMFISALFGTLGAGYSMATRLFSYNLETKIPEQLLGIAVIIIRFVIGAASALILFFLYRSGFFESVFSDTILKSYYAYIVFSFVAGFSERWVSKMLALVVNDK